jgi:hypothetical protein
MRVCDLRVRDMLSGIERTANPGREVAATLLL